MSEKQFITEFLEVYKNYPCLWKIKSKEYSDRYAKSQASQICNHNAGLNMYVENFKSSYDLPVAKNLRVADSLS